MSERTTDYGFETWLALWRDVAAENPLAGNHMAIQYLVTLPCRTRLHPRRFNGATHPELT